MQYGKHEWKARAKSLKEFSLLNRIYWERTKLDSSAVMNRSSVFCLQQPSQLEMEGPEAEVKWQTDEMGPLAGRTLEQEHSLSTQQVRSRTR